MIKSCLVIDDNPQDAEIEAIVRGARKQNIELKCFQFNVGSTQRSDLLTNGRIDSHKVIEIFRQEFSGTKIDLICIELNCSFVKKNHRIINWKRLKIVICEIKVDVEWVTNPSRVKHEFHSYFTSKFRPMKTFRPIHDSNMFKIVTHDQPSFINSSFTREEIKKDVWD